MRTFETAGEFGSALDEVLRAGPADAALRGQLAASVSEAEAELRAAAPEDGEGLNFRVGRFFLREEDLPVLETIGIATTAALALLAPGAIVAGVVISAAGSFAGMVWKAWRNGAMLTPDQIAVLALVKLHGPLAPPELAALAAKADPPMTLDAIGRALAGLSEAEMRDGDIVALVDLDDSGRLRARPV